MACTKMILLGIPNTIMTDSPVEYLRNDIFDVISGKFPTPFMYCLQVLEVLIEHQETSRKSKTYFQETDLVQK